MSLNKQHFDIVTALTMQSSNIKVLASVFNMTSRNLRYAIENINYYLEKLGMTPIALTQGELHYPHDPSPFFSDTLASNFIFSKHEREEYLATIALFAPDTPLCEIQNYLRVSRPTLNKDLRNTNETFNELTLELEVIDQHLCVTGKEKQIRYLQMCYASKYLYCKNNNLHYLEKRYFFERDIVAIVRAYMEHYKPLAAFPAVSKIEQNAKCSLSHEFKNLFTIYLMITLIRIEQGVLINRKNNGTFLQSTKAFGYIQNALNWHQESYRFESLHLAEYFLGGINTDGFYEKRLQAESFIYQLLSTISQSCVSQYCLEGQRADPSAIRASSQLNNNSLLNDTALLNDMVTYLTTAVYRAKNNLNTQLGEQSPYSRQLFEQVKVVATQYSHLLVEPLRDEEIGYLTRLINRAIEARSHNPISLEALLSIAKNCSSDLNCEEFVTQILSKVGKQVIDDRTLPALDDLLVTLGHANNVPDCVELIPVLKWLGGEMEQMGLVNEKYTNGVQTLHFARNHAYFAQHGLLICHGKSSAHSHRIGIVHLPLKSPVKDIFHRTIRQVMMISHIDNVQHLRAVHQLHQRLTEQDPFSVTTETDNPLSNRSTSALSAFHPVE
ncbi:helix-turn-helix domain-containing protein [Vibrio sp. 404]|uniref:Helix-turn-helix domain-containing protein n=1 Tax=Vibrio marinisediminis TaxID=2758441 RepID=A0A7W2FPM4_9VIBR|nr:helix-turn-helix domain-containing protein [Vibrio marinisediminis]MBA5761942.1 helix-turn-helix domain-containing protein [Vibrio marinisediminis]